MLKTKTKTKQSKHQKENTLCQLLPLRFNQVLELQSSIKQRQ